MTCKTHPSNVEIVKKHIIDNGQVVIGGEGCTVPVRKESVFADKGIPAAKWYGDYQPPPDEKFVEYEESDLEWMIPLGMADKKMGIPYKKSASVVWGIDGVKFGNWVEGYCYADHCDK